MFEGSCGAAESRARGSKALAKIAAADGNSASWAQKSHS